MKAFIKLIRILAIVALFVSALAWLVYYTVVQFSNPNLTDTQRFLQTWHWMIPMIASALLVALLEYMHKR